MSDDRRPHASTAPAQKFNSHDVAFLLHEAAGYRSSATDGNGDWGNERGMRNSCQILENLARRIAKLIGVPARVQCQYCDGTGKLFNGAFEDRACFGTGMIPPRKRRAK